MNRPLGFLISIKSLNSVEPVADAVKLLFVRFVAEFDELIETIVVELRKLLLAIRYSPVDELCKLFLFGNLQFSIRKMRADFKNGLVESIIFIRGLFLIIAALNHIIKIQRVLIFLDLREQ